MKKFTPRKTLAILAFSLSGLSINAHATCNVDEVCVTGIRYTYDQGIEMYQKNYREDLNKVLQNQGVNSFMIGVAIDAKMKEEMMKVVDKCLAIQAARKRAIEDATTENGKCTTGMHEQLKTTTNSCPDSVNDFQKMVVGLSGLLWLLGLQGEWTQTQNEGEACEARAQRIYEAGIKDVCTANYDKAMFAAGEMPQLCTSMGIK